MAFSPYACHVLFRFVREWNETLKSKDQHQNTAANPGCPMIWWKETTQRATNIDPAVPGVTQRFLWLKQYSIRSKGNEKPKLGIWAPCMSHIEIYSQPRVQDVQIISVLDLNLWYLNTQWYWKISIKWPNNYTWNNGSHEATNDKNESKKCFTTHLLWAFV